ncbi:MAG: phosphate acetyltransferase [Melioribacteraceae bacterium]|nr:phosphate acetyltransferase [Melioribacteraceae bacterium]MCO6472576.1 phosphate acetyltransferase [Melioribacteraceae bacterium]MDD3559483.1 phosphate acetyltransferase [Melioribacteraceae bacterium]
MAELELLNEIKKKASERKKTIVLPESHDERVLKAAEVLQSQNIASVITLGNEDQVRKSAEKLSISLNGVRIIDPQKSDKHSDFSNIFFNLRKSKGITIEEARETMKRDLFFGAMMVRENMAEGFVAGSTASTADVLRAAIQCVGMPEGISIVSSFFLMIFPEKTYSFADCAVVPNPDANQLADIAISTAENHQKLTGEEPYVAMLSFSTKGSAKHELVDKVLEALKIVKEKKPNLKIDGELQFDAAVIDSIGKKKAPGSDVAGRANVLIFPDLQAGNIGYKIAQRLGGAEAVGPVVQGLKKPLFDLSRGCSVDDIVNTSAIAVLMS